MSENFSVIFIFGWFFEYFGQKAYLKIQPSSIAPMLHDFYADLLYLIVQEEEWWAAYPGLVGLLLA